MFYPIQQNSTPSCLVIHHGQSTRAHDQRDSISTLDQWSWQWNDRKLLHKDIHIHHLHQFMDEPPELCHAMSTSTWNFLNIKHPSGPPSLQGPRKIGHWDIVLDWLCRAPQDVFRLTLRWSNMAMENPAAHRWWRWHLNFLLVKPPTLGLLKPACFLFSTSGVAKPHGPIPMFPRLKSQFPLEHRHFQLFEANVPFVRHILGGTKFPIWFPFPMFFLWFSPYLPMIFPHIPSFPHLFPGHPPKRRMVQDRVGVLAAVLSCILGELWKHLAPVFREVQCQVAHEIHILNVYIYDISISLSRSLYAFACVSVYLGVYILYIYISWFICSYIIKAISLYLTHQLVNGCLYFQSLRILTTIKPSLSH